VLRKACYPHMDNKKLLMSTLIQLLFTKIRNNSNTLFYRARFTSFVFSKFHSVDVLISDKFLGSPLIPKLVHKISYTPIPQFFGSWDLLMESTMNVAVVDNLASSLRTTSSYSAPSCIQHATLNYGALQVAITKLFRPFYESAMQDCTVKYPSASEIEKHLSTNSAVIKHFSTYKKLIVLATHTNHEDIAVMNREKDWLGALLRACKGNLSIILDLKNVSNLTIVDQWCQRKPSQNNNKNNSTQAIAAPFAQVQDQAQSIPTESESEGKTNYLLHSHYVLQFYIRKLQLCQIYMTMCIRS